VSQDDQCPRTRNAFDLLKGAPRKRRSLHNNHVDLMVRQRNFLSAPVDQKWDWLATLRSQGLEPAGIYVPCGWMPPFATDVHDKRLCQYLCSVGL
jgi:hypothetical protein